MKWKYQNLNLRRKFYCVGVATWDELLVSCKIDYLTLDKLLYFFYAFPKIWENYIVDLLKETYIWKIHVKKFGDEFDIYCGGNVIKILRVR